MKLALPLENVSMSCWVVPTIAADFLGISLEQVLEQMQCGQIASKTESGFTFVDVAPDSPIFEAPKRITPPTYTIVSNQEIAALTGEESLSIEQAREDAYKLRRPPLAA